MRLRKKAEDLIRERFDNFLSDDVQTVWDVIGVAVMIESIKFEPIGADKNIGDKIFTMEAVFSGILRIQFNADNADQAVVEPLLANLVESPIFVPIDPDIRPNDITEYAKITLIEYRNAVRAQDVVSDFRMEITGALLRRQDDFKQPDICVGQSPKIGPDNEDQYRVLKAVS